MDTPTDTFIRKCQLLKIVDGDTLRLRVDLGWGAFITTDIRLAGLDTPEVRGPEAPAGKFVEDRVSEFIGDLTEIWIHSKEFSVGKFGRCLCEVWVGGRSLNAWLLERGFAWPTDDGGRLIGSRRMEALAIPEGIRQKVKESMS